MSDVGYYYPPVYQHSPPGNQDYLGPSHDLANGGAGNGVVGKDGASTLTGSGPPPQALGKDGDSYFSLDADGQALTFYSPKANGQWPVKGVNLVGAAGAPGTGISGGDGPPDETNVAPEGSLYLDRSNIDLYQARA